MVQFSITITLSISSLIHLSPVTLTLHRGGVTKGICLWLKRFAPILSAVPRYLHIDIALVNTMSDGKAGVFPDALQTGQTAAPGDPTQHRPRAPAKWEANVFRGRIPSPTSAAATRSHSTPPDCVFDGEICVLDQDGKPDFNSLLFGRGEPVFVAFNLMFYEREDVRTLPLKKASGSFG